ncbi:MAG: polymer-forming cytoskeletal protein [Pyrinomonadaceae bacterium]
MAAFTPALQKELGTDDVPMATPHNNVSRLAAVAPRRIPPGPLASPAGRRPLTVPLNPPRKETSFQPRVPTITGEASYRGSIPVDGIISGQLGAVGSAISIKQRPKNGAPDSTPELDGELSFKDMLRINGHVAGKVFSCNGTLIIDTSAKVEAEINVAVCVISGIVIGDVIGHKRVEMGAGAIVTGNISTPTLSIKPGAVFQGDCRMLKNESSEGKN